MMDRRPIRAGFPVFLLFLLARPGVAGTWSLTMGDAAGGDQVWKVRELPSGDLLAAGATNPSSGQPGGWLVRLDADGVIASQRILSPPAGNFPTPTDAAALASDGGAFFTGRNILDFFVRHEAWVAKVDPVGDVSWAYVFYTPLRGDAEGRWILTDAQATGDGGVVAAGTTSVTDGSPASAWVVKMAGDGAVQWQHKYGGGPQGVEAVIQTEEGGYAVAGGSGAGAGLGDAWVMKLDPAGEVEWQRTLGDADQDLATGIVELSGGGYAVSGWTNSETSSRHAAWLIRLDVKGDLVWHRVFGDREWSDFRDVLETPDGGLLSVGRVDTGGGTGNHLWLVKSALSGDIEWQRAYEGSQGDWGETVRSLSDEGLLVGATWASGLPGEDFWLLRLGPAGLIPGCVLIRDTAVATSEPKIAVVADALVAEPPGNEIAEQVVDLRDSAVASTEQCRSSCPPLTCFDLTLDADPVCAGRDVGLDLTTGGGQGSVTVEWDFDGDGGTDATGDPVSWNFPEGGWTVTATASDECPDGTQMCALSVPVDVLSSVPPPEVSRVPAGAPPLRVRKLPDRIVVEDVPGVTAYNFYADALGSWYFPSQSTGSVCPIPTWTDNGDGTITLDVPAPSGSWFVVTASTRCAEGPAGADSGGTERTTVGTWQSCGGSGFSAGGGG